MGCERGGGSMFDCTSLQSNRILGWRDNLIEVPRYIQNLVE